MYTSLFASRSALLTSWPTVTAAVPSFSSTLPAAGSDAIFTAANVSPAFAPLNPKSAAAMTREASSAKVRVLSAPEGTLLNVTVRSAAWLEIP